eukprot:jgi/Ulvmu1/2307/UM013_0155.1
MRTGTDLLGSGTWERLPFMGHRPGRQPPSSRERLAESQPHPGSAAQGILLVAVSAAQVSAASRNALPHLHTVTDAAECSPQFMHIKRTAEHPVHVRCVATHDLPPMHALPSVVSAGRRWLPQRHGATA